MLHDDEEFVAASTVREVYEMVRRESSHLGDSTPDEIAVPAVIEGIERTAFTSYDKARMVGASRRIERHAWEVGGGELHSGFQRLSRAREQWRLYTALAANGIAVHVYGAPDWDIPPTEITVHGDDAVELTDTWFVVYDAADDADKRALLAEERGPNNYHGFWTDHAPIVDTILRRLRTRF